MTVFTVDTDAVHAAEAATRATIERLRTESATLMSQLRQLQAQGVERDVVLVYVAAEAAELAFRDELAATGARVVVFTRDQPHDLPPHWTWAHGVRLDADGLDRFVPDIADRHAFISGPPRLIADLAPALQRARALTTDAFAGY